MIASWGRQRSGRSDDRQVCGKLGPMSTGVSVLVCLDVIPNKSMTGAVECQRQLKFRMVMPLERYSLFENAMCQLPGSAIRNNSLFKEEFHTCINCFAKVPAGSGGPGAECFPIRLLRWLSWLIPVVSPDRYARRL